MVIYYHHCITDLEYKEGKSFPIINSLVGTNLNSSPVKVPQHNKYQL